MHLLASIRVLKNLNIIQLSQNLTPSNAFNEIQLSVLDGMSDNMASFVESENYGAINTTDTPTNGFYVIMFASKSYTLRHNTTIDGKIITPGELVVTSQYHCYMQVDTSWYWNQHPQQHLITVPIRSILHQLLEVNAVADFHAIPKSVCNRTQAKKAISRQPLCLTDSDYNYMLE